MRRHEGVYICGYCKKETPLEDDKTLEIISEDYPSFESRTPCSCGHFSYASGIRFKGQLNFKDWKMRYGRME